MKQESKRGAKQSTESACATHLDVDVLRPAVVHHPEEDERGVGGVCGDPEALGVVGRDNHTQRTRLCDARDEEHDKCKESVVRCHRRCYCCCYRACRAGAGDERSVLFCVCRAIQKLFARGSHTRSTHAAHTQHIHSTYTWHPQHSSS